jgi:SNF2 family DNA or RNA helicase
MQLIGLLLLRSNQRREALNLGEQVREARSSLIVVPQGLIPQWRDEITNCTDRFHVAVYYGPNKKSSAPAVGYVGSFKVSRLTRNHQVFDGTEANYDTIVLTNYTTLAARHGPKASVDVDG